MAQERVQIDKKAQAKKASQKKNAPATVDTRTPSGKPLPY